MIPVTVLLLLIAVAAYAWTWPYLEHDSAFVQSAAFWLQLASALGTLSIISTASSSAVGDFALEKLVAVYPWAIECFLEADFVTVSWMQFTGFALILFLSALAAAVPRCSRFRSARLHRQQTTDSFLSVNTDMLLPSASIVKHQRVLTFRARLFQRGKLLLFLLLDLAYLPISTRILQIFVCAKESGPSFEIEFLVAAPYVLCSGSAYSGLWWAAVAGVVLCIVGVPVLFLWLIWPVRSRLDKTSLRFELGFMWNTVRRELYWWPVVRFGRRLLVAVFVTRFEVGSVTAPMAILALLLVVIVLQLFFRPYVVEIDNSLEVLLLSAALFSFMATTMAGVGRVYFGANGVESLASVLMFINTAIKIALMLWFVRLVWKDVRVRCALSGVEMEVDEEFDTENEVESEYSIDGDHEQHTATANAIQ